MCSAHFNSLKKYFLTAFLLYYKCIMRLCLLKFYIKAFQLKGFKISLKIFSDFKCSVVLFLFLALLLEVSNLGKLTVDSFTVIMNVTPQTWVVVMDLKLKAVHAIKQ